MFNYTTTLIAPPSRGLTNRLVQKVAEVLKAADLVPSEPYWLAVDQVCDLTHRRGDVDLGQVIRALTAASEVDFITQLSAQRRKALLVADMESTIIEQELLNVLGQLTGHQARIEQATALAMDGHYDFRQATRERVKLLRGTSLATLEQAKQMITFTPGARALVRTMRAHGSHCVLLSGGFDYFTASVRQWLGFDEDYGNRFGITASGQLDGHIIEPIIDAQGKLEQLNALLSRRKLEQSKSLAVGDGANDLLMLAGAGLGVAFHAKPSVAQQIPHRVDYGDLSALLYAQGYHQGDILE